MTAGDGDAPDFSTWPLARLTGQQAHLESILPVLNERDDPEKPQIRAELVAIRTEIASRTAKETTVMVRPVRDLPGLMREAGY